MYGKENFSITYSFDSCFQFRIRFIPGKSTFDPWQRKRIRRSMLFTIIRWSQMKSTTLSIPPAPPSPGVCPFLIAFPGEKPLAKLHIALPALSCSSHYVLLTSLSLCSSHSGTCPPSTKWNTSTILFRT